VHENARKAEEFLRVGKVRIEIYQHRSVGSNVFGVSNGTIPLANPNNRLRIFENQAVKNEIVREFRRLSSTRHTPLRRHCADSQIRQNKIRFRCTSSLVFQVFQVTERCSARATVHSRNLSFGVGVPELLPLRRARPNPSDETHRCLASESSPA
jgi:hypothetical protein